MNFKILKEIGRQAAFDELVGIGRSYRIGSERGIVLGFTRKETEVSLWMVRQRPEGMQSAVSLHSKKQKSGVLTRREEKKRSLASLQNFSPLDSLRKIVCSGKTYSIVSTGCQSLSETAEVFLVIQKFLEAGVVVDELEEVDWEELILEQIVLAEEWKRLPLKLRQETGLKLILKDPVRRLFVTKKWKNIPVNRSLRRIVKFSHPTDGREICCYINKISLYDPCSDEELSCFEDPEYRKRALQYCTEEQLDEMKQEYIKNMRVLCPEGMYLPVIEYESERCNLEFHTIAYLDEVPVRDLEMHPAVMLMLKPDRRYGERGLPLHCAALEAVTAGTEEISVELCAVNIMEESSELQI